MTPELLPVSAPGVEPRGSGTHISLGRQDRDRLIRPAKTLSWLSLASMTVEGAVAIIGCEGLTRQVAASDSCTWLGARRGGTMAE